MSNEENKYKWQLQLQFTGKGVRGLKSVSKAVNNPDSQACVWLIYFDNCTFISYSLYMYC